MKHKRIVEIPATTRETVVKTTCDLCGKDTRNYEEYAFEEVKVSCRTGRRYPDCGWGTDLEADMCADCFKDKLVPWLKEQGAAVREEKWDDPQ